MAVASNEYHIVTTWRIPASPDEITEILGDAPGLARWWPSVYLEVRQIEAGDAQGVGKVVELWSKGFLPYTLRWRFKVVESDPPRGFRIEALGDFVGRGIWTLRPDVATAGPVGESRGPLTVVTYDWLIIAEKGILKTLSVVMKPIFAANHRWAMGRGEQSLKLELARRHASTDPTIQAALPDPPGPTFPHNLGIIRRRGLRGT